MKYKGFKLETAYEADSNLKQVRISRKGKVLGIEHTPFTKTKSALKWAELMIDIGCYPYQSTLDDYGD